MREIKFRGKEYTGDWITGGYVHKNGAPHIVAHIVDRGVDEWRAIPVIPATVGQFTGLRDAKGVEIYEGDIVRIASARVYEVIFEQCAYRVQRGKNKLALADGLYYNVINNVHDAPELMKK